MTFRSETEPEIKKIYFRIGEVAQLVGVDASVLRHWESEFALRTGRARSGQRLYRQSDLRKLLLIKQLLYVEKYTTKGAIRYLQEHGMVPRQAGDPVVQANDNLRETLLSIRKDVTDFLSSLRRDEAT